MKIKDMFEKDINRTINGVVQVEQDKSDVIYQELDEYVVTTELNKHFLKFFKAYSKSFDEPTNAIGVWITGFFGSGKSHFLKMLSYLLENKEINGKKTVEYFRNKIDDPAAFIDIDKCTNNLTETILFNIDVEGSMYKDDTAILKVFTKVFYKHLGYYGDDLKVVKLEQYVDSQGKYDEFKSVFEEIYGQSWVDSRETIAFLEDEIVETLVRVLGKSEESMRNWFNDDTDIDITIKMLVDDIKKYVSSKPKGFRLCFMIDEVGQYISTNTSLLLNLQSIVETIGSECQGSVWVFATGQEALDDMVKVRENEFSRILARFDTRLSLTSSSVDEVIKKRILVKDNEATNRLEDVYKVNSTVLNNIYTFTESIADIKGYRSDDEFINVFPFVPYQFTIMQKIFNEIRKHGHAGKHQSSGERSMLNGFQESVQRIQNNDEYSVAPLYLFYDTLHSFLDTSVRAVIERAQRAADENNGLVQFDINVLKLLYLIRYIEDIPSNIENISILMVDKIDIDKLVLKNDVKDSLERLMSQNYIGRIADTYVFLTDEEQDIAREIKNTTVDNQAINSKIKDIIFGQIYTSSKYNYNKKYDFSFSKAVDGIEVSGYNSDIKVKLLTALSDDFDKQDIKLKAQSVDNQAIIVLSSDFDYFDELEKVEKLNKYKKQHNIQQMPKSKQDIIDGHTREANSYYMKAVENIDKAITKADIYICGDKVNISKPTAKETIDSCLEYLVQSVYSGLDKITKNYKSDLEIENILKGKIATIDGLGGENQDARDEVYSYIKLIQNNKSSVVVSDIISKFTRSPFGWNELDVSGVLAWLVFDQKISVKYSGMPIDANDQKMTNYLTKKNYISNVSLKVKESIKQSSLLACKRILSDYFDLYTVPSTEKDLIEFIIDKFNSKKLSLMEYRDKYKYNEYPGANILQAGYTLVDDILNKKSDNVVLVEYIVNHEEDLLDNRDDLELVEEFFKNQVDLYDAAHTLVKSVENIEFYFDKQFGHVTDDTAINCLNEIKNIIKVEDNFNYSNIKKLNTLVPQFDKFKNEILNQRKEIIRKLISDYIDNLNSITIFNEDAKKERNAGISQLKNYEASLNLEKEILVVDSYSLKISGFKSNVDNNIAKVNKTAQGSSSKNNDDSKKIAKVIKNVNRLNVFSVKNLQSKDDIDKYLNNIKEELYDLLEDCDGININ